MAEEATLIELCDISIKEKNLLNINLAINSKDIIAIIGKPSSGKHELSRILELDQISPKNITGHILYNGKDFLALSKDEQHIFMRQISYISTKAEFINHQSVYANIELCFKLLGVSPSIISNKIQQFLQVTDLLSKQEVAVNNLNTLDKIKLDIARKLVNQPKVLIGVDLNSKLDAAMNRTLDNLIVKISTTFDISWILLTNDPSTIKGIANKVCLMSDGHIVEHTVPADLFSSPKSEVAKDYIKYVTKQEIPIYLKNLLSKTHSAENKTLIRFVASDQDELNENLQEELINFELNMDIVCAYQEQISSKNLFVILVLIKFEQEHKIAEFIRNLSQHNINSETIAHVNNIY